MTIRKILVPIAPNQNDLTKALEIFSFALTQNAEILVLRVIEDADYEAASRQINAPISERLEVIKQQEEKKLLSLVDSIKGDFSNLKINIQVETGHASEQITKISESFDLIAIDPLRKGKKRLAQAGSVTRYLLRHAVPPVWCLGQHSLTKASRVVAAINLRDDEENKALNNQLVQSAISFATSVGADLHLLHAWNLEGEGFIRAWERKSELEIAQIAEREKNIRLRKIEEYADKTIYKNLHINLVEGQAKEVISNFISENDVDLLLMGTFARTNLAGIVIGNTAEILLDYIDCPLVAFKSESIP